MKAMIAFIGLLTILGGLLPFLKDQGWLTGVFEVIPTSGLGYQILIIGIGVVGFIYGVKINRVR